MKKTKITCTIGPASDSKEVLRELFQKGLNVCRLNFSHGVHEGHQKTIDNIKAVREELDLPIAIMLDTKGPEIRLGDFKEGEITVEPGDEFTFTTRDILGDQNIVSISYEGLPEDVEIGTVILVDDGLVEMEVIQVDGTEIKCKALNTGDMSNHKGVNVPNVKLSLPSLVQKDIDDIIFGIKNEVDFIAPSFIRKADDVLEIRRILEDNGGEDIEIISKIENQEGVDNLEEILIASDGVMVARGDLGVEIETEQIPLVQKMMIRKANEMGKAVITATQMLDSMIRNPRPTRAEVTDVANAILDGSDSVMLSGETAAGKYPVRAVETMSNIAMAIEGSENYKNLVLSDYDEDDKISITNAIGKATCSTASELGASAIITATASGFTSKALSKFRPETPVIAATTNKSVMRKLALTWGVYPVLSPHSDSTDDVIELSIQSALEKNYVKEGDLVVVTAGVPVGLAGSTNLIKVHTIGEILVKGMGIGKHTTLAKVCKVEDESDLENKFEDGDVIVTKRTDKEMVPYMERASAIITEEGGLTSHAAIVGLNLNKPTIVGVKDALRILKDGEDITVDSTTGLIYKGEARVL